ncbi:cupin domain-containing protein [Endobacter medicaginis]
MSRQDDLPTPSPLSRRVMLGAATLGSAGLAARALAAPRGFGNPDAPAEGRINAAIPGAASNPGPQNPALAAQFPNTGNPPATDINGLPQFWASFNNAHLRQQSGGWARQVTQDDFAISTEISGVNMRLSAGGIREMHWHQQAEWAFVSNGTIRITVLDTKGRAQVADVNAGGLWYFPAGLPHSLQGVGPDGGEFILAFDNGRSSEFNTLLLTDWIAHTPPEVLAKNFQVPADAFRNIPLDNLWIFQAPEPGPLASDQQEVGGSANLPPESFVFDLSGMKPTRTTAGGSVRIANSVTNFHASKTVAVAEVRLRPGGLREMHWHPNADEWQYYVEGQARMTVFNTGPKAQTEDFRPGDIGYIPKALGHYIENTGPDELVFLEIFRTAEYQEISLNDWLTRTPKAMVQATLNISADTIARFPRGIPDVLPG